MYAWLQGTHTFLQGYIVNQRVAGESKRHEILRHSLRCKHLVKLIHAKTLAHSPELCHILGILLHAWIITISCDCSQTASSEMKADASSQMKAKSMAASADYLDNILLACHARIA
jgi:hypothetical protein